MVCKRVRWRYERLRDVPTVNLRTRLRFESSLYRAQQKTAVREKFSRTAAESINTRQLARRPTHHGARRVGTQDARTGASRSRGVVGHGGRRHGGFVALVGSRVAVAVATVAAAARLAARVAAIAAVAARAAAAMAAEDAEQVEAGLAAAAIAAVARIAAGVAGIAAARTRIAAGVAGVAAARARIAAGVARIAAAVAAVAMAAVHAQHAIQQLEARGLATDAKAQHERSDHKVPFHLSNVSFAWTGAKRLSRLRATHAESERDGLNHPVRVCCLEGPAVDAWRARVSRRRGGLGRGAPRPCGLLSGVRSAEPVRRLEQARTVACRAPRASEPFVRLRWLGNTRCIGWVLETP